jgi:hypothetical protein
MDRYQFFCTVVTGGRPNLEFFSQTWIFWCQWQFWLSYSNSPELLTLESIICRSISIENFFVMDRFVNSGNRRQTSQIRVQHTNTTQLRNCVWIHSVRYSWVGYVVFFSQHCTFFIFFPGTGAGKQKYRPFRPFSWYRVGGGGFDAPSPQTHLWF